MKKLILTTALIFAMAASQATDITIQVTAYGHTVNTEITVDDALYGVWLNGEYIEAETMDEIIWEIEYYIHQTLVMKK